MKKRLLVDCDTGIDDSIAILCALKSKDVVVDGITTMFGNVSMEQATENTLRIIALANPGYDVPVAMGAKKPLVREARASVERVHGKNGIGNVDLPPAKQQPIDEGAADFIVRMANENPGELILVTLGRLTNLALAWQKDPSIAYKLQSVVVMGGSYHGQGNVTPVSEANIWGDPEAADMVFRAGFRLTLVGLNVTTVARLYLSDFVAMEERCSEKDKSVVRFVRQALRHYMNYHWLTANLIDECYVHDPLAMVIALNPSLATLTPRKVTVDCSDGDLRGMIVADHRPVPAYEHREIFICTDVEYEEAMALLKTTLCPPH